MPRISRIMVFVVQYLMFYSITELREWSRRFRRDKIKRIFTYLNALKKVDTLYALYALFPKNETLTNYARI